MNDGELLKEFVERDSESAFRKVMERHLPLVYGTARRILANSALAEDVAQTVFLLLARKARADLKLTGWLYNTTRFVATRALRGEIRRTRREQEAVTMNIPDPTWQHVAPNLDDALASLGETDRNAILCRFFEERGLRDVGAALGVSEEAAKKRVARALDKLRRILTRRGMGVSAAALAAGLAYEASALPAELAAKMTAATLAQIGSAEATGLLAEVISALRWAKIRLVGTVAVGLTAIAFLLPVVTHTAPKGTGSDATASKMTETTVEPLASTVAGEAAVSFRGLHITVLDEATELPIAGAEVKHSLMYWGEDKNPQSIKTDANGVAALQVPQDFPDSSRLDQFEVFIRANNYAPRNIRWVRPRGGVLGTVTNDHTISLERGITLSGRVVDDSGQPLFGVIVGTIGGNYRGYTVYRDKDGNVTKADPEFEIQEADTYPMPASGTGPNGIITDYQGRFELPHFPSRLEGLQLEFVLPEGSHRKFRTPRGAHMSAESLPEVSIEELKSGTARFVLAQGVMVEGVVVDAKGKPVPGAEVTESIMIGNLRVLSRNRTDQLGQFRLENRTPREVMLSAAAPGHAGITEVVTIAADMPRVSLRLPPERPLRGIVMDEAGQPVPGAKIQAVDYLNDGMALEWEGTTDGDGRFTWDGAPTNQVFVAASAKGFTMRYARVRSAVSNNVITLGRGVPEAVRISGMITDATSGKPVEHFTVQLHAGTLASLPEQLKQKVAGGNGAFEIIAKVDAFEGGPYGAWVLQVIADGYERLMTPIYRLREGDQHLELKMEAGGTLEGLVLAPNGSVAAGATFAVCQEGDAVLAHRNGELSPHKLAGHSDPSGRFSFPKPLKALALVVFHESGWAAVPLRSGPAQLRVQLEPWGRIEGIATQARKAMANEWIGLHSLAMAAGRSMHVLYDTRTDNDGRFSFPRVPQGEFEVNLNPRRWRLKDTPNLYTMEHIVVVRSGDVKTVNLGEDGATVTARLELPRWLTGHSPTNIMALLWKGEPTPPLPNPAYYATSASLNYAILNRDCDPAVLAAKRSQRHYVGEVAPDGTVLFQGIPAGRYTFEAKLFDFSGTKRVRLHELPVAAQLRTGVTIPENAENVTELGSFTLGPAN